MSVQQIREVYNNIMGNIFDITEYYEVPETDLTFTYGLFHKSTKQLMYIAEIKEDFDIDSFILFASKAMKFRYITGNTKTLFQYIVKNHDDGLLLFNYDYFYPTSLHGIFIIVSHENNFYTLDEYVQGLDRYESGND